MYKRQTDKVDRNIQVKYISKRRLNHDATDTFLTPSYLWDPLLASSFHGGWDSHLLELPNSLLLLLTTFLDWWKVCNQSHGRRQAGGVKPCMQGPTAWRFRRESSLSPKMRWNLIWKGNLKRHTGFWLLTCEHIFPISLAALVLKGPRYLNFTTRLFFSPHIQQNKFNIIKQGRALKVHIFRPLVPFNITFEVIGTFNS